MNKRNSYTSADAIPVKLLQNVQVLESIQKDGAIPPVHAQVIVTNRCNLKCSFCSCAKDDRQTEMGIGMVIELVLALRRCGTKAVTITGGGEPLLHPFFAEIIQAFSAANIQIGLVTNGLRLNKLDARTLNAITWIRISHSSDRPFNPDYKFRLSEGIIKGASIDWSFSYVVTAETRAENIIPVVEFANQHSFTHVRLVADLFHPEEVDMGQLAIELNSSVDDSKVIYQPRQKPERGDACRMGLLKPLISADGKVYACCGVQYALEEPSKSLPSELCLGTVQELETIVEQAEVLNGAICKRCYYGAYNRVLENMVSFPKTIHHREFV